METDKYTEEYTVDRVSGLTQILEIERTYKNENSEGMMRILPTAGQRKEHITMETGWYMRRTAADMIDKYMVNEAEFSVETVLEIAMLGSYGLQTSTYANYAISMGNYLQTCLNAYGGKLIEDIAANLDNLDAGVQSDNLSGYYQDTNGRWHRPKGQFASNAEVGISSSDKILTGTHGNSLANTSTNYGYALVDRNTNEILKFGETLYPDT